MVKHVDMSKLLTGAVLFIVSILVLTSCFVSGCSRKPDSIRYGAIPSGSAALVYIAQDRGFFQDDGLIVSVKDYPTGVGTTDALLKGEVDVAWSAEFPMVSRAFSGEEISIFAVSSRFSDQYLFGLKDDGIEDVSDLKGKRIGVPLKTIAEFYLARFLELNNINLQDISLVSVLPPQSVEAITSSSVDGVVTWEPYSSTIKEKMVNRIVAWPVQSSQPGFGVMIGRNDWLRGNPKLVQRFLRSLARAEDYLVHKTEAAKDIVQTRMNYDDAFMEVFWSETHFELSLDQSLIIAMEDEARWMIDNGITIEKQVPNFLDYIYEDALKTVKPEVVNIIR
jgi:NitT/TauT family transport system substrate-binding protein